MQSPWTYEELEALRKRLSKDRGRMIETFQDVRPLPPMAEQEALDMLSALMDAAHERPLTQAETFLHGQLLSVFRMAVRADTLGHPGRFVVVNQAYLEQMARKNQV